MPWIFVLIGYIFLAVFRPFEVWPQLGALRIELVYAIGMLITFANIQKNTKPGNSLNTYVWLLFLLVLISPIHSPYTAVTMHWLSEYWKVFLVYLVILYGVRNRVELEWLLLGFLGTLFLYELLSLIEYGNGRHMYRMGIVRMIGVDNKFNDPNAFAATICYSMPLVFMFLKYKSTIFQPKLVWLACFSLFLLGILCIVLTGSRTGMVGVILLLALQVWSSKNRFRYLIASIAALAATWSQMPASLHNRFESLWNPEASTKGAAMSAASRLDGFLDGLQMMLDRPIGFGAHTFRHARDYVGKWGGLDAHNLYGQVMGELGFLGAIALLGMVYMTWRTTKAIKANAQAISDLSQRNFYHCLAVALNHSLILLLFYGISSHNLYRYTWLWYAAFAQLGLFLSIKAVNTQPNEITK